MHLLLFDKCVNNWIIVKLHTHTHHTLTPLPLKQASYSGSSEARGVLYKVRKVQSLYKYTCMPLQREIARHRCLILVPTKQTQKGIQ